MTDDLDEMEQKLRDLWAVTLPKSALADEDRAVAVKLLGTEGARRLAATKRGERYRYRPQEIQKIEYHWVPAGGQYEHHEAGWTIEATQNGVRHILGRLMDAERCALVVTELKRRAYRVDLFITEPMKRWGISGLPTDDQKDRDQPDRAMPARSARYAIMDQLRSFSHSGFHR